MNYYNENDPKAAAWLRELIRAGEISTGEVDERSIMEVKAHELKGYAQCHFFAGIGGWSLALRLAGWPDDKSIWTGSCPCQPLSCAGQQKGHADERHLWPAFYELIAERGPSTVFGEQVASPDGREWFAGVRADLEGAGYAVGGSDLCAAGVAAPHPRQRIYWMAHAKHAQRREINGDQQNVIHGDDSGRTQAHMQPGACREVRGLVLADGAGRNKGRQGSAPARHGSPAESAGGAGWMGEPIQPRLEGHTGNGDNGKKPGRIGARESGPTAAAGAWRQFDICYFIGSDAGKARRVESGTFPLAHGVSGRVGLLRGYGNAIVPQLAAEFIKASVEAIGA